MIINLFPCRRVKNLNGNLRGGGGRLFQQDWGALTPRYILCRVTPLIIIIFFSKHRFDCCGETKIPRRIINGRSAIANNHRALELLWPCTLLLKHFFFFPLFFCGTGHIARTLRWPASPHRTNESGAGGPSTEVVFSEKEERSTFRGLLSTPSATVMWGYLT